MATEKNFVKRAEVYKRIEEHRERPLIVYATSTRPGVQAFLAGDSVREFVSQIQAIGDAKAVDVLIHSNGGDPLAAWRLMFTLREQFEKVGVLVPFAAFSAATLLALGADEIVMHPFAALGPIDPQIQVRNEKGEIRFAYEDVSAFLKFIKENVGVTEQAFLTPIIDKLFTVAEPLTIGAAQRASDLSSEMAERMLRMHMTEDKDQARCRAIAENLNKSFFNHGDAVSRQRARQLELAIAESNPELEDLMWSAFLGLERLMELDRSFHPLSLFMSDENAAGTLTPAPPLQLPANTPSQGVEAAWNAAINRALQERGPTPEVAFELVKVVVESRRRSAAIISRGHVTAARHGQEIQVGVVDAVTRGGAWTVLHEEASEPEEDPAPGLV